MRLKSDPQLYFQFSGNARRKVTRKFRKKYHRISNILDENPGILDFIHYDVEKLSQGDRKKRKGVYTSENILRALIVYFIEGVSLRDVIVLIEEMEFLGEFVRLGDRTVMDYSFLDKCFCAITPQSWRNINHLLGAYALKQNKMNPSEIRTDTTVVGANIHYPTDASLLWDSYRVLARLLREAGKHLADIAHHRFHDKKAKKLFLYITRYSRSSSSKRKQAVRRCFLKLIKTVKRLRSIAQETCEAGLRSVDIKLLSIATDLKSYLSPIQTVINTAQRANVDQEKVPAKERVFSIFEPHTELIKRGKAGKPVEFGHMVWLAQTREKFITDYEVMEKKIDDSRLTKPIIERHKDLFGEYPELLAADRNFRSKQPQMQEVEKEVKTLAIAKRLKDWTNSMLPTWERFRAGIEGSISVLKRAFRLSICYFRGFKNFSSSVGLGIFCHNLVLMI